MHKVEALHQRVLVPMWGIYGPGDAAAAKERLQNTPTELFKADGIGITDSCLPAAPSAASSAQLPPRCTLPRPPAIGGFGGVFDLKAGGDTHTHPALTLATARICSRVC